MKIYNRHHKKLPPIDAVYVGRPSFFGNPFQIGRDGSRAEVIAKYRDHLGNLLETSWDARIELQILSQANGLICWCHPKPCHAEVIIEFMVKYGYLQSPLQQKELFQ